MNRSEYTDKAAVILPEINSGSFLKSAIAARGRPQLATTQNALPRIKIGHVRTTEALVCRETTVRLLKHLPGPQKCYELNTEVDENKRSLIPSIER